MTPADIEQIVDAIDRLPWAQWAKGRMAAEMGPGAGPGAGPAAQEPAASPPAGVGGDRPSPPVAPPAPAAAGTEPPKKDAAGEPTGAAKPDYPPEPKKMEAGGEDKKDEENDRREREEYSALKKHYEADERYKRYSALRKKYGGDAADDYQQVPPDGRKSSQEIPAGGAKAEGGGERKDYAAGEAAGGSAGGSDVNKPAESSVDSQPANRTPGEGTAGADRGASAEPYARTGEIERYRREMSDLRKELETERGERVNTERYSRLQALRMRCAFDVEQAFDLVKYGKASQEQFEQQMALLEGSARPIPIGSDYLPTEDHRAVEGSRERGGGQRQQLGKYSRAHSDQAFRICEERAKCGKSADYVAVVQAIAEGRQPVFAD